MGSLNPSPDASPPHRDMDAEAREWVHKNFPDAKVATEGSDKEVRQFIEQHWKRQRQQQKIPGTDEKNAGKALMIFGILITILSFFGSSFEGGIFGFMLSIIG